MNLKQIKKKVRFCLTFFSFLILVCACRKADSNNLITVNYESNKAVGFSIESKIADNLQVFLENSFTTPVLGSITTSGSVSHFQPIIPFSEGRTYHVYSNDNLISKFKINERLITESTELLAIYPSTDSIPENLLKVYLLFSNPMQEVGSSLDHITVIDTETNQEIDVFLPLQTELWNVQHTQLTLWLDPGRIKRDLIPNKERGMPIEKAKQYAIRIDSSWKDAKGQTLDKSYQKTFIVIDRDISIPDTNDWNITSNSKTVVIEFNESIDIVLAEDAIIIKNTLNQIVLGDYSFENNGRTLRFTPDDHLETGDYYIEIESRLEDLAGNNLNRLFDTDLNNNVLVADSEIKILKFNIR